MLRCPKRRIPARALGATISGNMGTLGVPISRFRPCVEWCGCRWRGETPTTNSVSLRRQPSMERCAALVVGRPFTSVACSKACWTGAEAQRLFPALLDVAAVVGRRNLGGTGGFSARASSPSQRHGEGDEGRTGEGGKDPCYNGRGSRARILSRGRSFRTGSWGGACRRRGCWGRRSTCE